MKAIGTILCLLALFAIVNGEQLQHVYRHCNYIKHDLAFTLTDVLNVTLEQNGNVRVFERNDTEVANKYLFFLKIEGSGIEPGKATLKQTDKEDMEFSVEIIFSDLFFNPDLERMYAYKNITVTELACRFDRELLSFVHYNKYDQAEEIMFNETPNHCGVTIHDTAPTGYYEVFAKNPYTLENVYVSHFTHISDKANITKSNVTVQMPLPMKTENGFASFKISYSSEFEPIKQIYVIREISEVAFIITSDKSKDYYFEYQLNGNVREYVVYFKLEEINIMYYVERILLDNYYQVSFDEFEYSFGYYFSIENQFALSRSAKEVELVFDSAEKCETYKKDIYFKDLLDQDATIKKATCNISVNNTLRCQLDTTTPSVYALGITPGMVSSQIVNLFTYVLDSDKGVNICKTESINKESAKFNVNVFLPEYEYESDLKILGIMVSDNSYPQECGVVKQAYNHYIITCDANKLEDGLFGFELGIGFGSALQYFTVEKVNINVKKKYTITGVKEQELILTSEQQHLTIYFKEEMPQGSMTHIQLRQDDKVSRTFVVENDESSSMKKFTITSLIETGFVFDYAHIYFKYPCADGEDFEDSTLNILIAPNTIKKVEPNYVTIVNNSNATVTFNYPLGGVNAYLVFESGRDTVKIDLSNECCDAITVYGSIFRYPGSYYVSIEYPFAKEEFGWGEFFVFENAIVLKEDKDYVRPGQVYEQTEIELLYGVTLDQVEKIEYKNQKGEQSTVYTKEDRGTYEKNVAVNYQKKTITIKNFPVTLQTMEQVRFVIYDVIAPTVPLIFTVHCEQKLNLRVASLELTCQNPAQEGSNYVFFNFTDDSTYGFPYDVNELETIIFNRINRATGESSNFVFCSSNIYNNAQNNYSKNCNKSFEIIETTNKEELTSVRANVVFSNEDKYYYKYELVSMSDNSITRYFNEGDCFLIDFSVEKNIFGFIEGDQIEEITTTFEAYSVNNAEHLRTNISCAVGNSCTPLDECKELCFGESCGNTCDTQCEINPSAPTQLICTFSFNPLKIESTVYYRMSERDVHYKPLHIIKVDTPADECRLVNDKTSSEIQVCTYDKISGLRMFLNAEAEEGCNCEGIEIDSQERSCTRVPISYKELISDRLTMRFEKDYFSQNSFVLETQASKISLLNEVLKVYHGSLFAQLKDQKVEYVFPTNSNPASISKIILTHAVNKRKIEVDHYNCTVSPSSSRLTCSYDLEDKIQSFDLGVYNISYVHENCDKEFTTDLTIEVQHPPVVVVSLKPNFTWMGTSEKFTLTYLYYFYNLPLYQPHSITLVQVNDETKRTTVNVTLNGQAPNEIIFYSTEEFFFVPAAGRYYIIEHYQNKDVVHRDLTTLFLQYHIKIYPESATYYTDLPAPTSVLTYFLDNPIYPEQIRSVELTYKDVVYSMTHTNITFYFTNGLIDFTKEGEHEIVITEIDGSAVSFTVYVKERKLLSRSVIEINGPQPGYENTTNIVEFISSDYDLSRITRIEFELKTEFGAVEKYTVDRNRIIESYDKYTCTLKVELYLRHNAYYRLISIHNDETGDKREGFNYILQGFFLESHFYLVSEDTGFIMYHINFYTEENTRRVNQIYENNVPGQCIPVAGIPYLYECVHKVEKLLTTGSYADLLNVTLTQYEPDIKRTLQVFLVEYIINDYCVINKEPSVDVEVNFRSQGEIGTLRGVFRDKIFNGNAVNFASTYNYVIKYTIPIDYTIKSYNLYVQLPRFNEYYQYLIPRSVIKIIPQVFIVDVPENTITEDNNKEGDHFDIVLNEGLKEDDISRVVFKGKSPYTPDIELTNWKIMFTEHNTVFNFVLTEKIIQAKGEYYVQVYDACDNLIEPADGYTVFISYEKNFLTHIGPRGVKLSELGKQTFEFIYEKGLTQKPTVKLVDSAGKETDYLVQFKEPFNGLGVRIPLKVYITGSTQIGLFRIKTTFPENNVTDNVDLSNLKILIYNNEVEFTTTEFTFNYKSSISSLVIPLKKGIIKEQISRITRKVMGIAEEVELTSWKLSSEKEITITFSSKLVIDNQFQIIVYLAKDSSSKEAVTIKPVMPIRFYVNREFVYLDSNTKSFDIEVYPLYDSNNYYKDVTGITSSREELTFALQTGTYSIPGEKTAVSRRFVATYKKLTSVILPEELTLSFYMKNIISEIPIGQRVAITDKAHPFFDFGMQRRIIYKTEPFEMKLLDNQYFHDMNYTGLKSYLLYNTTKKLNLNHDTTNERRFYLEANKLDSVRGLTAEIMVVEKNDDTKYVSKGEKVEFSTLIEPPIVVGTCKNEGTMVGGSCKCKEGFYGQYCDKSIETVSDFTKEFYSTAESLFNENLQLNVIYPSQKDDLGDYTTLVKSGSVSNELGLQEKVGATFNDLEVTNGLEAETLFLMGDLMIDEYNNAQATRRLGASRITPEEILQKLRRTVEELEIENVKVLFLPIQEIHFDKVRATEKAFAEYQSYLKSTKSTYFDIKNLKESANNYYLIEHKTNSLTLKYLTKDGRLLEETKITPDKHEGDITVYFNVEDLSTINTTLLQEYSAKGINIYNAQEPAFSDKCYSTNPDYFDYDLTQKYRKNLYQGNSLEVNEPSCQYKGLNSDGTYISFACNYPIQSEEFTVSLDVKQQALREKDNKTHDFLALKCIDKITDLPKNIALWLFMVLAVVFVVGTIMKFRFSPHNQGFSLPVQHITQKDNQVGSAPENNSRGQYTTTAKNNPGQYSISTEDIQLQDKIPVKLNEKFSDIFLTNLKSLHPITANYYNGSKCITSIFMLTICSLFGFNALYFKESYIEERIFNESRNSFAYPFVNEAGIIFASIFTTVLFTILTKLISSPSKAQSLVRDIICLALCSLLILFWWVYSVGFCGMYKNTQIGWLCAGVWALLFNWIIFAPVSILIVSILESKLGKDKMTIIKHLFWV